MALRRYDYEAILKSYAELQNMKAVERQLDVPYASIVKVVRQYDKTYVPGARRKVIDKTTCKRCDNPVVSGRLFCQDHLTMFRTQMAKGRKERRRLGLCQNCDKPYDLPSRSFCTEHRLEHTEAVIQRNKEKKKSNPIEVSRIQKLRSIKSNYGPNGVACFEDYDGRCAICYQQQGEIVIDIHHINCNETDHSRNNLICLCRAHHQGLHAVLRGPELPRFLDWIQQIYVKDQPQKAA